MGNNMFLEHFINFPAILMLSLSAKDLPISYPELAKKLLAKAPPINIFLLFFQIY